MEKVTGIKAVMIFEYLIAFLVMSLIGVVLYIGGEHKAGTDAFFGVAILFFFALGYIAGKKNAEK